MTEKLEPMLTESDNGQPADEQDKLETLGLSEAEVETWLQLFNDDTEG